MGRRGTGVFYFAYDLTSTNVYRIHNSIKWLVRSLDKDAVYEDDKAIYMRKNDVITLINRS